MVLFLLFAALFTARSAAQCTEPYAPLSGGAFTGPAQPLSPDPLVTYLYGPDANTSALQVFIVTPVEAYLAPGTTSAEFSGWESLTTPTPRLTIQGAGGLTVNFGVELPAWIEIDSSDLAAQDVALITLGSSEYNRVDMIDGRGNIKQGPPKPCGAPGSYRLETNPQLYEGVRYGFLSVKAPPSAPFTITAIRAVAQAKPVNYTGSFSGDALTTRIYYAAAYTVRTNLEQQYMGAILEDRGDRYSWAGDAHVSQAASLAVFGNTWDVAQNLIGTAKTQNGIASYSLYFADSVMDFYAFTHDLPHLNLYAEEVTRILTQAYSRVNATTQMTFYGVRCPSCPFCPSPPPSYSPLTTPTPSPTPPPSPLSPQWDDRLGSGFANASTSESQWDYKLVLVKLLQRWGEALASAGNATQGAQFTALSDAAWAAVQAQLEAAAAPLAQPWWGVLGIHAAAEALATQRVSGSDATAIITARLNDTTTLCSLSNFNQYWILGGLAAAGALDRGLASISLCWGPELAMGGTTFWEISSPDWVAFTPAGDPVPNGENGFTSLCHPWSSGPAAWLAQHSLGVQALLPGSAHGRVLVAPHVSLPMLLEACTRSAGAGEEAVVLQGTVPVGSSVSVVSVKVGLGSVTVTLPQGDSYTGTLVLSEALVQRLWGEGCSMGLELALRVEVGQVYGARSMHAAKLSLPWLQGGSVHLPAGYTPPLLENVGLGSVLPGRAAVLPLASGATTTLTFLRPHCPPAPACSAGLRAGLQAEPRAPFPPPSYPHATFLGQDSLTRGSWGGVYGGDGGVLFGGGPGGAATPRLFLPPYVLSAAPAFHDWGEMAGTWDTGVNTSDARAPENPPGAQGSPRTAGYTAANPTFAFDVALGPGAPQQLLIAAYALDWDSRGRRQSVALLDGDTLSALTPIQGMKEFEEGVWLPWVINTTACKGFRLRVQQIRGDNSVLSALLFGPAAAQQLQRAATAVK